MFGKGKQIDELKLENEKLKSQLQELGALEHIELQTKTEGLRQKAAELDAQMREEEQKLRAVRADIVETEDALILQEVGVYQFRHPLDSATQYKDEIASVKERMKAMVKEKTAVHAN